MVCYNIRGDKMVYDRNKTVGLLYWKPNGIMNYCMIQNRIYSQYGVNTVLVDAESINTDCSAADLYTIDGSDAVFLFNGDLPCHIRYGGIVGCDKILFDKVMSLKSITNLDNKAPDNWKYEFQEMLTNSDYCEYAIPTDYITAKKPSSMMLHMWKRIVLKPLATSHGAGILKLERLDDGYRVLGEDEERFVSASEFQAFLNELTSKSVFQVQPYIDMVDKQGNPATTRILVARNGSGHWQIVRMYSPVGIGHKIVSNRTSGGTVFDTIDFIKNNFDNAEQLIEKMNKIAEDIPNLIDKEMPDNNFTELGIDVGISQGSGNIYIPEVNIHPASPDDETKERMARYNAEYYSNIVFKENS